MNQKEIMKKKIETLLLQKIKDVYSSKLEHNLSSISYIQFDCTLIILIEGTITSSEKLLQEQDRWQLAEELRIAIDKIIKPQIKTVIEEVMEAKVIDFLSDTTIKSNLTGAIAIFES